MMGKYKILKYNERQNYHECIEVTTGNRHKMDFFVGGGKLLDAETHESVIGKIIEVEYTFPFLELTGDVISITDADSGKGE